MIKAIRNIAVLVVGVIVLGRAVQLHAADANPPDRMTYQGYLVDSDGDPLGNSAPANYDVVFRIYNVKSGGIPIWSEQQTITVDKGYFSVLLGEGVQINSEVHGSLAAAFDGADASDRFIGITVSGIGAGDLEISPRLRLVTSPYSFTATQARRLTDGDGNSNFFKDDASLKLGAGSTPTLTLPEAGGASLSGKLTVGLPSWGSGLQIDNGSLTTTMGALDSSQFHFTTGLPKFNMNKPLEVSGSVMSYNQDLILGPSNNTDTYLKISSGSDDIHAYADNFYIRGDHNFNVNLGSNTQFLTDAPKFYMNKPLEIDGDLTVSGSITGAPGPQYVSGSQGLRSVTGSYGTVQTTGGGAGYWEGYSIDGRYVLMSQDNNQVGLYNDIDDKWIFYYSRNHHFFEVAADLYVNNKSVGIRTHIPLDELHINHAANGNYSKGLRIQRAGGPWWAIGTDYAGDLIFGYYQGDDAGYKAYIARGDGGWKSTSDLRLKKDIEGSEDVLSKVYKLKPVRYRFKEQDNDAKKSYGLIAQDVQELFPYLVNDEKDYLGLDYGNFGVLSIKAIQELGREKDAEVASLEKKNEQLESRVQSLESELSLVKAQLANKQNTESRLAKLEEIINNIDKGQ